MTKFIIPPEKNGYSLSFENEVITTTLAGGPPRQRRRQIGSTSSLNATWILDRDQYNYFMRFYRGVTRGASEPFELDLILDSSDLVEREVRFVPGSVRLTQVSGLAHTVVAELIVTPIALNEDLDEILSVIEQHYGADGRQVLNPLEQLVNVDIPNTSGV